MLLSMIAAIALATAVRLRLLAGAIATRELGHGQPIRFFKCCCGNKIKSVSLKFANVDMMCWRPRNKYMYILIKTVLLSNLNTVQH